MSDHEFHDNPSDDEESFFAENQGSQNDKDNKKIQDNAEDHERSPRQKKKKIRKNKEKGVKNGKRSFSSKEKDKEIKLYQIAQKKADAILEEMNSRYEKDVELFRRKQLACKKLSYLQTLSKELRNIYVCEKFLDANGLQMFEKWLSKVSLDNGGDGYEPSLALRKGIFQILLFLNVKSDNIVRSQELQRIIQKNKRSQMRELRDLSDQIILKWSQLTYDDGE